MKSGSVSGRALAYARGGDAIVETSSGKVFVSGAVPGDLLRISRPERAGGASFARIESIESPSEDRVEPVCAYAHACGGCPFMAASLSRQRETKRGFVSSALGVDVPLLHAGDALGYRRRARLAFDARRKRLGYARRRSHELVDVARCPILVPVLDDVLTPLRGHLLPLVSGAGELRVALGAEGRPVLRLESEAAQSSALYTVLDDLVRDGVLAGASVLAGGASKPAALGDPRERAPLGDGSTLLGTDAGFSQANADVNALMVEHVARLACTRGERVLELYAGHGNLTVALAEGTASYVALELDAAAVAALAENARARGLDVRALAKDARDAPRAKVGVVVLDPPRTGAAEALDAIVASAPERIVYVSCDPGTLARDLRALLARGYVLREALAFDMFPQTPHVETVALLERV